MVINIMGTSTKKSLIVQRLIVKIKNAAIAQNLLTSPDLCPGYGGFFIMTQEVNPSQRDRGCQVITSATSGDIDVDNISNVLRTIVKCLGYNRTIRVGSYFGDASEDIALNISQGTNHHVEHYLYTKDYLPLLCYLDPVFSVHVAEEEICPKGKVKHTI